MSIGDVADAIRNRVAAQPPIVNIEAAAAPNVTVEAPPPAIINVEATMPMPVINVEAAAAPNVLFEPQINLPSSKPVAYSVRITERDANGFISAFVITPA